MPDGPPACEATTSERKGGNGIGPEIIAKLVTVMEVELEEVVRMPARERKDAE
jgi:hypothetical protein